MGIKRLFIITICLFFIPFLVEASPTYRPRLVENEPITSESLGIHWQGFESEKYGVYYKKERDYTYIFYGSTITPDNSNNPVVYYLNGLEPGIFYSLKAKACDEDYDKCFESDECVGSRECFYSFPLTLATNPGKPSLNNEKASTLINLFWQPVDGATLYQIGYKNKDEDNYHYMETSQKEYLFNNLTSDTGYNFKIQACNDRRAGNNNGEYEEGCSGFTRSLSIKTPREQAIADLQENYEKKSLRMQKTLSKYFEYINKYENLSLATRSDFANEITNSAKKGILDLLKLDLEEAKSETEKDIIEAKIIKLDTITKSQIELLKYKLKIYKNCDRYYKKFENFRNKVGNFLEIPEQGKNNFIKEDGYIDKVIEDYKNNYEMTILSERLPITINLEENLVAIRNIYKNIRKDENYKIANIVYKIFYNINKINVKLENLKNYSDINNRKFLRRIFIDYYSPEERFLLEDKYREVLDSFKNYYKGYAINKPWSSYDTVYNDYKHLRANDRYKRAVIVLSGLKKINSILDKQSSYYYKINSFSKIPSEIKSQASGFNTTIRDELLFSDNSYTKRIIDNQDKETLKEISRYFSYKNFGYLYKGVELTNKLNIKIANLEKIIEVTGDCPAASNNIEEAENKRNLVVGYLREFTLDNLEITRLKYSELKNVYKEALNYYKSAISETKKCL